MGEKPLSIDESHAQASTIGGSSAGGEGQPAGYGIKEAPPGAAVGPVKPTPTNPGDPFPADPGPGGGAGGIATDGDPIPGLDVKLGKNPGGAAATGPAGGEGGVDATPAGDAPGVAGGIQPIPGVDIVIKR